MEHGKEFLYEEKEINPKVYFATVEQTNEKSATQKFVKQGKWEHTSCILIDEIVKGYSQENAKLHHEIERHVEILKMASINQRAPKPEVHRSLLTQNYAKFATEKGIRATELYD